MKLLKVLLSVFGLVIVLVVIVVGVFVATFDANQYKQELSELVRQQTGRNLTFQGDIGLTLYPALGMKLGSLELSNASGFGQQPMIAVNTASVSVDLLSLLSLNPQIAQLVLDGLKLDLQKNAQGRTNWDDLLPADAGSAAEATDAETAPADDTGKTDAPLQISGAFAGLNITNADVRWKDAQAGAEYTVNGLSLLTGRMELEQEFPLELKLTAHSAGQLSADVELSTRVLLRDQVLVLSDMQLNTEATGPIIPVDQVNASVNGKVDFNLADQDLGVTGFNTRVTTRGGVVEQSEVRLSGEIGFDLAQQQLVIGALAINLSSQGEIIPNGAIDVSLSSSELDMQLPQRTIKLPELALTVGADRFEGFVTVRDYAQPAVDFQLTANKLDVDTLTGWQPSPATDIPAEQPPVPQPAEDVQIALPMELLRSLDINGDLRIGRVIAQGLTLDNLVVKLSAQDGLIGLEPLAMDLYDGTYAGAIQVDARGDQPKYRVQQDLAGFQFGDFLMDFMQQAPVSGQANLNVDVTTAGEWLSQLKSGLNGTVAVAVADGALSGFNLRHEIDRAKAKFRGESLGERTVQKTDFSALSLSGVINNGVFASDDLNLQAPVLRVGGAGKVDLVQEAVDYLVKAKIVGTTKAQGAGTVDDLGGLLVPVKISGSWLAPQIDVQYDEMMKAKLDTEKARIAAEVEQEKAALQKKLDAEKAKLEAAKKKQLAAEKAALEKKKQLAEAEKKAQLAAEKQAAEEQAARQKAELEAEQKAKQQAAKEKAKKELEEKLKKLQ